MVSKGRHPNKDIEEALTAAEDAGLIVKATKSGHRWGYAQCQECKATMSVWSTPRVPEHMAQRIDKFIVNHQHRKE